MTTRILSLIALVLGLNVAAWFFEPGARSDLPMLDLALEAIAADGGTRGFSLTEKGDRWVLVRATANEIAESVLDLTPETIKALATDGRFEPVPGDGPRVHYRFDGQNLALGGLTMEGSLVGELVIDRLTFSLEEIVLEKTQTDAPQRITGIAY